MSLPNETILLSQWQKEIENWAISCEQKEIKNAKLADFMTVLIAIFLASMEFTRLFTNITISGEYSSVINFCVAVVVAVQKSYNFDGESQRFKGIAKQCYQLSDEILFQLNENIAPTRDLNEYTNSVKESREKIREIMS